MLVAAIRIFHDTHLISAFNIHYDVRAFTHTDPTARLYTRHVTVGCAKSTGPGCRAPEVQAKK